jgi:SAM-dependent methyltransferase
VERCDLDRDESLDLSRYAFDTVTCINVLEHTDDDLAALRRANKLLVDGGRVIVFVPAGKKLYGTLDRGVGHQRRYDRDELVNKLTAAGFAVEDISFQNRAAKLAWWINSKLFRRSALPLAQSRLFDRLVPLFRALEGERPGSGLSLIAVGRKPLAAAAPAAAEELAAAGAAS